MGLTQGFILPVTQKDGKQIVIMSPSTEGLNTWFHGAGDATGSVDRGFGQRYIVRFDANETGSTKEVLIKYSEPIELHDGQGIFSPASAWDVEDTLNFYSELPGTPVIENLSGTGNCNLYPIPGGNMLIPAMGDGGHDVDLTKAVPIPSDDSTGFWNVNYFTGEVSPSETPGQAGYQLLDFQIPNQYFVINMPCGQGHGVLDVDVYKTQWIHQNYVIHFTATKNSVGAGKVALWLLGFRRFISREG